MGGVDLTGVKHLLAKGNSNDLVREEVNRHLQAGRACQSRLSSLQNMLRGYVTAAGELMAYAEDLNRPLARRSVLKMADPREAFNKKCDALREKAREAKAELGFLARDVEMLD